jgi:hypothetical protein
VGVRGRRVPRRDASPKLQKLDRGHREANEKLPTSRRQSLDEIDRLARTPVYETPFEELNEALGFGGLLAGQVYYLAGGTGFGKTSFIGRSREAPRDAATARADRVLGDVRRLLHRAHGSADHRRATRTRSCARAERPSEVMRALPTMIEFLDSPSMSVLRELPSVTFVRAATHR